MIRPTRVERAELAMLGSCVHLQSAYILGETPMNLAAQSGHLDVIEFYLDKLPGDKNPKRLSNDEFEGVVNFECILFKWGDNN